MLSQRPTVDGGI
uniref:Uncharacterized protein n=1 Tax=Rhizophora mucronata TaxID=61149 RepID=A0A2P2NG96_RHIMU